MWLEMIVGGGIVTFSQVGMHLDEFGRDPRCEWAPKIEAEARRMCGRTEGIRLRAEDGDLSIWLHEDAVPSVVRAITEALPSMPVEVQGFYQKICYLLENGERVRLTDYSGP
jgi:hypothetical protein